jgi:hypothetical protein
VFTPPTGWYCKPRPNTEGATAKGFVSGTKIKVELDQHGKSNSVASFTMHSVTRLALDQHSKSNSFASFAMHSVTRLALDQHSKNNSRMRWDYTHVRLKRTCVWPMAFRSGFHCSYRYHYNYVETLKERTCNMLLHPARARLWLVRCRALAKCGRHFQTLLSNKATRLQSTHFGTTALFVCVYAVSLRVYV